MPAWFDNMLLANGDDDHEPEDRKAGSDSPEKKRIGIQSPSFSISPSEPQRGNK
jgi:hypothetical protein